MRDPSTIPASVAIHNLTTSTVWVAGVIHIAGGAMVTIDMTQFNTNELQPPFSRP